MNILTHALSVYTHLIHFLNVCSNRLELEDVAMKHNSAIKQLMREFNTQMALKETEADTAVKETIGESEDQTAVS